MNKIVKKKKQIDIKKVFVLTPKKFFRGLIFLLLGVYLLVGISSFTSASLEEIDLSEALVKIKDNEVKKVVVYNDKIELSLGDDEVVFAQKEPEANFTDVLKNSEIDPASIDFQIDNQNWMKAAGNILATLLPLGLTALLFLYIFKQMGRAQNSVFSFGKSKAKLFIKGKQSTRFKDVAGLKEVKEELMEVVDFLKRPEKYRKVKARTPKGALLVGPSGVGKTLLARAVAGEAGVAFFSMAGSEFMEMLVGVGASRVRDLFSTAKKMAPSIIFIDEIDAIGRARGGLGVGGGHDEREQTLNQILVEMDGFEGNDRVLVVAATNRGDLLDPALLRPGRFDRRFVLTLPDIEEREEILRLHAKGKPFRGVKWERMARQTVGFSGADLENMVNEAAILSARKGKTTIAEPQLEEAALKVKLGPEKRRLQSENDKKITAYHEAGHAVVSQALPDSDPVSRVSIISRGMALGYTLIPPKKDRLHETKTYLLSQISVLLGGRAAEELIFNEMTTGAGSDIEQATKLARRMVIDFGMSSLGPVNYGPQVDGESWQGAYVSPQDVSPETKFKVDSEIKKIIDQAYQRAKDVLLKESKALGVVAERLIEKETLDQDEFEKLIKSVKKAN